MKRLKKIVLVFLSILVLLISTGYVYLYVLPKGPAVTKERALQKGIDTFVMYSYKNSKRKSIRVWTYKPENWKDADKMLFVMHGGGRNAKDYLEAWIQAAEEQNMLIVAPEFANKFSSYTTNDYQEGNLFTFFKTRNPEEEWGYTVIENIFEELKNRNGFTNDSYDIFGHSAGGQFVHRMILLKPDARIENAIAANPGFYTFPKEGLNYPYGINNIPISEASLSKSYTKKFVLLLGELDNDPKLGTFRTTEHAMQQGRNRLDRGSNFYFSSQKQAQQKGMLFTWKMDTIANVGHDYRRMSEAAARYLKAQL